MKVLASQLAVLTEGRPKTWNRYLEQIEFAYRTTPHTSTGESPFYLMYGYDAQMPDFSAFKQLEAARFIEPMQKIAMERMELLRQARTEAFHRLLLIAEKQKEENNQRECRNIEYEIGELILVKISPVELQRELAPKLCHKWT